MDVSLSSAAGSDLRLCFRRNSDGPNAAYTLAVGKQRSTESDSYRVASVFNVPMGSRAGGSAESPICVGNVTAFR